VTDKKRQDGSQARSDPAQTTPKASRMQSIKATQTRVVDQMTEVRSRLELARPRSATIDSAFLALARDTEAGGGVLAAAVAFRVFMFMIPYIFVVIAAFDVAGSVASKDPHSVAHSAGIGGLMAQAVSASAKHLQGTSRFFALAGGLVAVFLAGRAFLKTLRIMHALVWGVRANKPARPSRAVLVLILLVTMSILLSVGLSHLRNTSGLGGLGATVLYTTLPCGIWLALEFGMPHAPRVGWKDLLPGAVLFGVAALALHLFTVYWVAHLIKKRSATYGAIGSSLALLLWAYVFGRIMTASAVLNASIWARTHPRDRELRATQVTAAPRAKAATRVDPDEVVQGAAGPEVVD
jgi:uncharacterized BrkB/YihY/UPF0761 family membrane protein